MISKIYRILLMLQIIGTTLLGTFLYDLVGTVAGFVLGVLITGHFMTTLDTRDLNAKNAKLLKDILEELKKNSSSVKKIENKSETENTEKED